MNTFVQRFAQLVLPWLTLGTMLAALYLVFIYVPTDKAQGIIQRIFYFHVPLAIMTYVAFTTVAVASAIFLWNGSHTSDRIAYASAEVGLLICTAMLTTGPIWAKPIWGTWWTWDARLTTTLILWLIYAAYLMLRMVAEPGEQSARYAAILGIIGIADIPIIRYSVYWWRTIHPVVITTREGGTGLADPRMQVTLLVCFLAFFFLFLWLLWVRAKDLELHERVEALRQEALAHAP